MMNARPPFARVARGFLVGVLIVVAGVACWSFYRPRAARAIPARSVDHWAAVTRGRDWLERKRPDLALKAVMHVRDERPGAGEAMAVAGRAFLELGDARSARLALERALKLQPRQAEAARLAATLWLATGDATRGLALLRVAAEADPNDHRPWLAMSRVHHDLAEPGPAADALAESLRRNPNQPEARADQIAELLQADRAEEATAPLAEGLRQRPADPRLLGLAARQAHVLGETDRALELGERALAITPANVDALTVRARSRMLSGDGAGAAADLEKAIAARPFDLPALNLLSQAERLAGRPDRAAAAVERHRAILAKTERMSLLVRKLAETPDDPTYRVELGRLLVESGQRDLARRCYLAALEIDPDYDPARQALALLGPETRPDHSGRP